MDKTAPLGQNKGTMTPGTKSKRETNGSSTSGRSIKGIKNGISGRHLEETEHHDRMGHSCESY